MFCYLLSSERISTRLIRSSCTQYIKLRGTYVVPIPLVLALSNPSPLCGLDTSHRFKCSHPLSWEISLILNRLINLCCLAHPLFVVLRHRLRRRFPHRIPIPLSDCASPWNIFTSPRKVKSARTTFRISLNSRPLSSVCITPLRLTIPRSLST